MTTQQFAEMPNEELLRRIYVNQLRMQMELETISNNVIAIRKKVQPEAFEAEAIKNDNPFGWRHLNEISKTMEEMMSSFESQLKKKD